MRRLQIKKLKDYFKRLNRPADGNDPDDPRNSKFVRIIAAFAVVGGSAAVIAAGLQHGAQGYEARKAREDKLRAQRQKRAERANRYHHPRR